MQTPHYPPNDPARFNHQHVHVSLEGLRLKLESPHVEMSTELTADQALGLAMLLIHAARDHLPKAR